MIKIGKIIGDVIEAGGVKNVTNNYYTEKEPKSEGSDLLLPKEKDMPEVLASEEAMEYWSELQEAGFVDADCQLMPDTTRKQAMCIAELFAEKLGIKSKWKTFEQWWGVSNLAQEKWDMLETGSTPSRSKEIDKIFRS